MLIHFGRCKKNTWDVLVFGDSLSSLIAAYCCFLEGLSVCLAVKTPLIQTELKGSVSGDNYKRAHMDLAFDSLAPEGRNYLKHFLSKAEIDSITLGSFSGIWRANQFEAFSGELGTGIQIRTADLKKLLHSLINASAIEIREMENYAVQERESDVQLISQSKRDGKNLSTESAAWLLDGTGKQSTLTSEPIKILSEPIYIERVFESSASAKRDQVEFEEGFNTWRWYAYDSQGLSCYTRWCKSFSADKQYFNSQWYSRSRHVDGRKVLLYPTGFRFDPSAGLGMTIAIKSALLAVKSVSKQIRNPAAVLSESMSDYSNEMQSTFQLIYQNLSKFYRRLSHQNSMDINALSRN